MKTYTKVELSQMIDNRLRKGLDARDLVEQLKTFAATNVIRTNVIYSKEEKEAVMLFNNDKRFTINE
jgi:hypothetical protein